VSNTTGFYPRIQVDTTNSGAVGQAGGVLLTETIAAPGLGPMPRSVIGVVGVRRVVTGVAGGSVLMTGHGFSSGGASGSGDVGGAGRGGVAGRGR
jgi:hypothetical protein